MTEEDRQRTLDDLDRKISERKMGIDNKNPLLMSHIVQDLSYMNKWSSNWFCSSCPYRDSCPDYGKKPLEPEELLSQLRLRKGQNSSIVAPLMTTSIDYHLRNISN